MNRLRTFAFMGLLALSGPVQTALAASKNCPSRLCESGSCVRHENYPCPGELECKENTDCVRLAKPTVIKERTVRPPSSVR